MTQYEGENVTFTLTDFVSLGGPKSGDPVIDVHQPIWHWFRVVDLTTGQAAVVDMFHSDILGLASDVGQQDYPGAEFRQPDGSYRTPVPAEYVTDWTSGDFLNERVIFALDSGGVSLLGRTYSVEHGYRFTDVCGTYHDELSQRADVQITGG